MWRGDRAGLWLVRAGAIGSGRPPRSNALLQRSSATLAGADVAEASPPCLRACSLVPPARPGQLAKRQTGVRPPDSVRMESGHHNSNHCRQPREPDRDEGKGGQDVHRHREMIGSSGAQGNAAESRPPLVVKPDTLGRERERSRGYRSVGSIDVASMIESDSVVCESDAGESVSARGGRRVKADVGSAPLVTPRSSRALA